MSLNPNNLHTHYFLKKTKIILKRCRDCSSKHLRKLLVFDGTEYSNQSACSVIVLYCLPLN